MDSSQQPPADSTIPESAAIGDAGEDPRHSEFQRPRKRRHKLNSFASAVAIMAAMVASVSALWLCSFETFPEPRRFIGEFLFSIFPYWMICMLIAVFSVHFLHACVPDWERQSRFAGTLLAMVFAFIGTLLFVAVLNLI